MRVLAALATAVATRVQAYPGPYPPGGSCNLNGPQQICLAAPFSSNAVLQRAPAKAAITGSVPKGYGPDSMTVTVALVDEERQGRFSVNVTADVRPDLTWKVLLPPRPTFGNYSLTAQCTAGCTGENATAVASLLNLTFGDVYACAGPSISNSKIAPLFVKMASKIWIYDVF